MYPFIHDFIVFKTIVRFSWNLILRQGSQIPIWNIEWLVLKIFSVLRQNPKKSMFSMEIIVKMGLVQCFKVSTLSIGTVRVSFVLANLYILKLKSTLKFFKTNCVHNLKKVRKWRMIDVIGLNFCRFLTKILMYVIIIL